MKNTLQIFINQRFWREIETTVASNGALDLEPAVVEISNGWTNGKMAAFGVTVPKELTSVEIRPVRYI